MKYLIISILLITILTGCGNMTFNEMEQKKKDCKELELDWRYMVNEYGNNEIIICKHK